MKKKSELQGDVLFSVCERVSWRWQTLNTTERSDQHLQLLHITGVQRSGLECLIFFLSQYPRFKIEKQPT